MRFLPGNGKKEDSDNLVSCSLANFYVYFTIAEVVVHRIVGVPVYEGVYHAFTIMSTGGFSIHSNSISFYSPVVHWIIIFFMIIASANFTLHYYAFYGKKGSYRKDP